MSTRAARSFPEFFKMENCDQEMKMCKKNEQAASTADSWFFDSWFFNSFLGLCMLVVAGVVSVLILTFFLSKLTNPGKDPSLETTPCRLHGGVLWECVGNLEPPLPFYRAECPLGTLFYKAQVARYHSSGRPSIPPWCRTYWCTTDGCTQEH